MPISGLNASSIDVQSIVSQLMAVERQPVDKLNKKTASYQTQLSVFSTLKGSISKFQSAVKDLTANGKLQSFSIGSSDTSAITATASSTANPGSYSIAISSLAQSQQLVAAGQLSSTDPIGTGATTTLSFDSGKISYDSLNGGSFDSNTGQYTNASFDSNGGGVKTVTIDNTNNTLEGIRDAVNSANIGVTATIINDGGATPYRLAFSTNVSGENNSVRISVTGDSTLSNLLSHDPAGTQNLAETLTAKNANFTVNGVAITKASNVVTDAVQGVTLNLNKVAGAVNLTVSKDTAAITSAANTFITEYNSLLSNLKSLSAYATATSTAGTLAGDPAVRQMISELQTIMSGTLSSGTYTTLASVGISSKPGVGFNLDSTLFNSALDSNLSELTKVFSSSEGFATKLDAWATASLNITVNTRTSNITDAISAINKEVDLREVRLASLEKRYTAQFTQLNVVLASMSSKQTFISSLNSSSS